MKGIKKIIYGALTTALLGLAACGPLQANKEGQIYMAEENGAKITTVINMARLETCDVPPYTLALAGRVTYFDPGFDRIPLTQVTHDGPGCSSRGSNNFIKNNPTNEGWKLLKKPEDIKKAEEILCAESDLRELNPELDGACNDWGRTK